MGVNVQALISDGYARGGFEQELAEALRDENLFKLQAQFQHVEASAATAVLADIIAEAMTAFDAGHPMNARIILGKARL